MVELQILTGSKAGAVTVTRFLPLVIGRSATAQLQLEDPGVFDRHATIKLDPKAGFLLQAEPDAFLTVDGEPAQNIRLRNGAMIGVGSVQLRFALAPPRQRSLRLREVLTWIGLALLCLMQVGVIYWLLD